MLAAVHDKQRGGGWWRGGHACRCTVHFRASCKTWLCFFSSSSFFFNRLHFLGDNTGTVRVCGCVCVCVCVCVEGRPACVCVCACGVYVRIKVVKINELTVRAVGESDPLGR